MLQDSPAERGVHLAGWRGRQTARYTSMGLVAEREGIERRVLQFEDKLDLPAHQLGQVLTIAPLQGEIGDIRLDRNRIGQAFAVDIGQRGAIDPAFPLYDRSIRNRHIENEGIVPALIEDVRRVEDIVGVQVVVANLPRQFFAEQRVFACFACQPWCQLR